MKGAGGVTGRIAVPGLTRDLGPRAQAVPAGVRIGARRAGASRSFVGVPGRARDGTGPAGLRLGRDGHRVSPSATLPG
jgi:hypothetical protein